MQVSDDKSSGSLQNDKGKLLLLVVVHVRASNTKYIQLTSGGGIGVGGVSCFWQEEEYLCLSRHEH